MIQVNVGLSFSCLSKHVILPMQVSLIMSDRLGKTKMKASEFRFKPVKTWFGGDQTEKIEGWKTYVYEAAGKMKAVTITKVVPRTASNFTAPCLRCSLGDSGRGTRRMQELLL